MRYLVVTEQGETSWGAHVPDLPGCIAVGASREEVMTLIQEAIELHLEDLRDRGETPPNGNSSVEFVEVGSP